MKYIAENAYIQVALRGNSFCTAAWDAFCLMVRNAGRFSVKGAVDIMLMILGKGLIVSSSAFITYAIVKGWKPNVGNPFIAVMVVATFAYVSATLFLEVFSFAAQTIMHAFLIAEENKENRNIPPSLREFIEENGEEKKEESANQAKPDDDAEA